MHFEHSLRLVCDRFLLQRDEPKPQRQSSGEEEAFCCRASGNALGDIASVRPPLPPHESESVSMIFH